MEERIGKIKKLDNFGLGLLVEEGGDGLVRAFTFDKIDSYRGEHVKELRKKGFMVGTVVRILLGHDDKISSIKPLLFKE